REDARGAEGRDVPRRGDHLPCGLDAAVADAFRSAARRERARDAPSWPVDAHAAHARRRPAPDARTAGAHEAVPGAAGEGVKPGPRFSKDTLSFLKRLKRNNRREWFNARKDEYEEVVRRPMTAIVEQLAVDMRGIAPEVLLGPS